MLGDFFELGWRLGRLLTGTDTGSRREAGGLPVDTRLLILTAGSRVLAGWPDDLHAALRGLAIGSAAVDPSLPAKVRSLAKAANLWPAVREAIYATAPGLSTSSSAGVRSVVADAANAGELAGSLGVSQRIYERMRGNGAFAPVAAGGAVNQHLLFDAADAAPLRELLADRLPLASASERLDISHHGVEQLCCVGELTLITDERVLAAVKERHITKSSLDNLVDRIDGKAVDLADIDEFSADIVPLLRAMRTIGGREKPWAAAVKAMLSGDLPIVIGRSRDGRLMGRISIRADSVHLLADMTFDQDAYPSFAFDGRINRRDTEDLLNVDANTFSRAVRAGQAPVLVDGTYDRAAVIDRASELISGSEILVRWRRGGKGLPEPMKGAGRPLRVLQSAKPHVAAVRVPMESEYREFWELPYDPAVKTKLAFWLVQARAMLGLIRNLTANRTRGLDGISFVPRASYEAHLEQIGGLTAEGVRARALAVQRAIYSIGAGLRPPRLGDLPEDATAPYAPFDAIQRIRIEWAGEPIEVTPLVMLDDVHALHHDQLEAMFETLSHREMRFGRWMMMRLDALSPGAVLRSPGAQASHGRSQGRDFVDIRMQVVEDGKKGPARVQFRTMAKDMAKRYLPLVEALRNRGATDIDRLLPSEPPSVTAPQLRSFREKVDREHPGATSQ